MEHNVSNPNSRVSQIVPGCGNTARFPFLFINCFFLRRPGSLLRAARFGYFAGGVHIEERSQTRSGNVQKSTKSSRIDAANRAGSPTPICLAGICPKAKRYADNLCSAQP